MIPDFQNCDDHHEAGAILHNAIVKHLRSTGVKKPAVAHKWPRKAKPDCHLCGHNMSQPGEYLAVDGRLFCCQRCWVELPLCGQCGRGTPKQFCRECI